MQDELLYQMQNSFPMIQKPFHQLAKELDASPEEVIEITEAYQKTLNGHRLKLEFEDETEGHYFKGVE